MKKKLLFVYNANAGTGKIRPSLSRIIEKLCSAGYDITIYATQAAGEAMELVLTRGELYDVVVCSGGDGTINETISGAIGLKTKPVIGYIPTGTVNDFARSLYIPANPLKAVEKIVSGNRFACDIGIFNDRVFNYVAAFGAFTQVSYETPQKNKNALGKMAYFLDALRVFPELRGYRLKATADDKIIEGNFIFGMVSNAKSVGGFPVQDKRHHISLCDGKMELILVKNPENPIELEQILQNVITHNVDNNYLVAHMASKIEIEIEAPVKWTLDGESGGITDHAIIECRHKAIEMFAGK